MRVLLFVVSWPATAKPVEAAAQYTLELLRMQMCGGMQLHGSSIALMWCLQQYDQRQKSGHEHQRHQRSPRLTIRHLNPRGVRFLVFPLAFPLVLLCLWPGRCANPRAGPEVFDVVAARAFRSVIRDEVGEFLTGEVCAKAAVSHAFFQTALDEVAVHVERGDAAGAIVRAVCALSAVVSTEGRSVFVGVGHS